MHYEAKHSYFKQVIRHTSCFKNAYFSLTLKHQMTIAYHLSSPCLVKSDLEVSSVSNLSVDFLRGDIAQVIRKKLPDTSEIHLAHFVTTKGITYRKGMILAHRVAGGFCEIYQICILHECVLHCQRALRLVQRALQSL